jgi:AbrB family looped-hinge helix DNA binding protein
MAIVKVSPKGQVVIPAEVRKKTGLQPGAQVFVYSGDNGRVIIEPVPDDPIEASCGMFQDPGFSYVEALLKERREDEARLEKKFARFLRPARPSQPRTRVRKGSKPVPVRSKVR